APSVTARERLTEEGRAVLKRIISILTAIIAVRLPPAAPRAARVPRVHRHPARIHRRLGPEDDPRALSEDDFPAAGGEPFEGLWQLQDMPAWLHAIARSDHLKTVMERNIAEFASGVMALERVQPRRRRL